MPVAEPAVLDRGAAVHDDQESRVARKPGSLPVHDAQLKPQAACPGLDRLASVGDAQFRAAEHVDDVEWTRRVDGFGECQKAGMPSTSRSAGLTGTQS